MSAALFAAGAQGVHEDGASLVTHFPPEIDLPAVIAALHAAAPGATVETGVTPAVDWSLAWRDQIRAHTLGRLTVAPPWLAGSFDPAWTVVIEPGMAFGTGDHPTTRGVIRLMQSRIGPGFVVADLGSGSAVLSIAAAKLGASKVYAIEYDGEAIPNAEENVRANGVEGTVHLFEGDAGVMLPLIAPVDTIVANIISSVHVELLAAMAQALVPGGHAVLSGILHDEREAMLEAFEADGWRVVEDDLEELWWSATIARP